MQCTYYYYDKECKYRKHFCFKKEETVNDKCYNKYCTGPNYDTCPIYSKNKESNCFFEAILCEKMQLPQDNSILSNLNNFRKNTLEQDAKYRELLVIHDRLSPIIADAIRNTTNSSIDEFLEFIYSGFLVPINKYVINEDAENVIYRYRKMLELLIVNFSLEEQSANINYYYQYPERYKSRTKTLKFF